MQTVRYEVNDTRVTIYPGLHSESDTHTSMVKKVSRKRKGSSLGSFSSNAKRAKTLPGTISQLQPSLEMEHSDDQADAELQDILAQIKAQEENEQLARQLDQEYSQPVASGSNDRNRASLSNGDSDLPEILAQIAAQEESERLAKQLQGEYDTLAATGSNNEINGANFSISVDQVASGSQLTNRKSTQRIHPAKQEEQEEGSPSQLVRPDKHLEPFRDLFTGSRPCTNCGKQVDSPRGYVTFSKSVIPPSLTHAMHVPCTSCLTNHCRGCFSPISCPISCKGASKNSDCKILICCAEIRAIAIFETLGGFDQLYILEQSASQSRTTNIAKSAKGRKVASVGPGGTGYGTGSQHGTTSKSVGHQETAPSTWEKNIIHSVNLLADLLPAPYCDDPKIFDILPHPSIGHLISLSQLPVVLGILLRNDSVTDWISRKETYNAILSLFRRMADCELTIRCLIGQRWEVSTSSGIREWMWQSGDIVWSRNSAGQPEINPPLYTYLKKLTRQSESFLTGITNLLDDGGGQEDIEETIIQGTSLCGDIIATRDDLERALDIFGEPSTTPIKDPDETMKKPAPNNKKSRKGKHPELAIKIDKVYEEACERLAFAYAHFAMKNYNFTQTLQTTESSTRLPKDRVHLLKELAVTSTSLPQGIWVRVNEVRNDAIKIMIAGPDGTPYAGGLFEFDCFIPLGYPNQPPSMHLRTTGHGTVRFNPNLYNCGKVCLSLLGTWSGNPEEQWLPGKSTLIQVFISIQSMILNEFPYFNEPGHGSTNPKNSGSIAYNDDIRMQTTKWAIVDWFKDENRRGIWRDVIASHFLINREKIRESVVEWNKKGHRFDDLLSQFDKGLSAVESWEVDDGIAS